MKIVNKTIQADRNLTRTKKAMHAKLERKRVLFTTNHSYVTGP